MSNLPPSVPVSALTTEDARVVSPTVANESDKLVEACRLNNGAVELLVSSVGDSRRALALVSLDNAMRLVRQVLAIDLNETESSQPLYGEEHLQDGHNYASLIALNSTTGGYILFTQQHEVTWPSSKSLQQQRQQFTGLILLYNCFLAHLQQVQLAGAGTSRALLFARLTVNLAQVMIDASSASTDDNHDLVVMFVRHQALAYYHSGSASEQRIRPDSARHQQEQKKHTDCYNLFDALFPSPAGAGAA